MPPPQTVACTVDEDVAAKVVCREEIPQARRRIGREQVEVQHECFAAGLPNLARHSDQIVVGSRDKYDGCFFSRGNFGDRPTNTARGSNDHDRRSQFGLYHHVVFRDSKGV